MNVRVSKRAARQIQRCQRWWIANRPASPGLLLEELELVGEQFAATPNIGTVYAEHKSGPVRRVVLPKTKHHVYYRYEPAKDEVVLLALWGFPRKRPPKL